MSDQPQPERRPPWTAQDFRDAIDTARAAAIEGHPYYYDAIAFAALRMAAAVETPGLIEKAITDSGGHDEEDYWLTDADADLIREAIRKGAQT